MAKYNWEEIFDKIDRGATYKEVMEEYGMAYATLVRKYKGYEAGRLTALEENSSEEMLEKLQDKELTILTQQKKNAMLRIAANKAARQLAIINIITDGINGMEFNLGTPKKFAQTKKPNNDRDEEQVFVISDLHYVDAERSASLNKMGRMWFDNWNGAKNIILVFNGDLIENTHHVSQLLDTDSSNPSIQAVEVANVIANQIASLCANLPDVNVWTKWTIGNHDEIRQLTKAGEAKKTNFAFIIKAIVDKGLEGYENYINTGYCAEAIALTKYSNNGERMVYSVEHGHRIKSNRQESIEQFIIKEHIQGGHLYDTYIISHFHQFRHWVLKGSSNSEGRDVEVIMTPSMKDWNGDFERDFNTRNTSGMISIDQDRHVKFIRIPQEEQ